MFGNIPLFATGIWVLLRKVYAASSTKCTSYDALRNIYCVWCDLTSPATYFIFQVFEELEVAKQEHGQLNHIIMNAAVMACVACKDIDRALALYDEMVEPGGCGVDNVTYGTLLKVTCPN